MRAALRSSCHALKSVTLSYQKICGNASIFRRKSAEILWDLTAPWEAMALTETPGEFSVSQGRVYSLPDWDGLETSIQRIVWQRDGALLACGTVFGETSCLCFDPEAARLTAFLIRK